jgi:hypothetical protein
MFFAGEDTVLDKLKKEKDRWIYLSLKLNLLVFQVKYKNKQNGFYRSLSSSGGGTIIGENNFTWFNKTFDQGFYRSSVNGTFVEQYYFFRVMDVSKLNLTNRLLLIRTKKMGAFNVKIDDINSLNYSDTKLLSSPKGLSSYQKVLKTYSSNY